MCFWVGMQHATQASWFSLRPRLLRYSGRRSSIIWRQIMVDTMRPLASVVSSPYRAYISFSIALAISSRICTTLCKYRTTRFGMCSDPLIDLSTYFSSYIRSSNHQEHCYRIQISLPILRSHQSLHSMTEPCTRRFYHPYFSTWLRALNHFASTVSSNLCALASHVREACSLRRLHEEKQQFRRRVQYAT